MIDFRHAIPTELLRSPRVIVSAVSIAVLGFIGLTGLSELGSSLVTPGVDPERADRVAPEFARHEQMALIHRKRFDGRSLFTTPLKPPSRPKATPVARTEPPKPVTPPKPPGPPATYGGPRPTGVVADTLFLAGGRAVKVGESADGVTVVRILPPDEVRVKWSGGEYTVSLRERFDTSILSTPSLSGAGRSSPPGITPVAADPPPKNEPPAPTPETSAAPSAEGLQPSVPAELDPSAVAAMSRDDATNALEAINRALGGTITDPTLKERLERERQLIVDRMNKPD